MARQLQPLVIETKPDRTRPYHLRVTMSGDLDDTPQVASELDRLAKIILQHAGQHGSTAAVIILAEGNAETAGLNAMPRGIERWMAFTADQPAAIPFIYAPSLFADRACDIEEYVKNRPYDVLVDSWYDK